MFMFKWLKLISSVDQLTALNGGTVLRQTCTSRDKIMIFKSALDVYINNKFKPTVIFSIRF